jgi:hypothetical protein
MYETMLLTRPSSTTPRQLRRRQDRKRMVGVGGAMAVQTGERKGWNEKRGLLKRRTPIDNDQPAGPAGLGKTEIAAI